MSQLQNATHADLHTEQIRVKGTVQGVGFRPFVWHLASQFELKGRVWNDSQGVVIKVSGHPEVLQQFREQLKLDTPPLAKIESVTYETLESLAVESGFRIIDSQTGDTLTNISADAATCPQCLEEINDPNNRRYRYPFTNCTHCGPRLSIIKAVPYDRANTSMAAFTMCPLCQSEYDDPSDRRFHAQPNACPQCGPRTWLEDTQQNVIAVEYSDELAHAAALIKQGYIIAIKGVGGFHLACDATSDTVVTRLRQRKQRYKKPFAMMARDISLIRTYAHANSAEEKLLKDRATPIVLLEQKNHHQLASAVAPDQTCIGFMLPYTPLHYVLLKELDFPIVLTSGNRSEEVQCITNEQAREQLGDIADYFLMHDRDIVNRLDDSVARIINDKPQLLRRARGYAPEPLSLPKGFEQAPPILAMGAELKNTFCLVKDGRAIVSPYQGDLEDVSVYRDYESNLLLYADLYKHQPETIAVDAHPNYLSTSVGKRIAGQNNIPIHHVQHHHAHIAACMIEHNMPLDAKPVLGISLDGLGYGDDDSLWGGEFMLADYANYQRLAALEAVAMPGGTKAIVEPWRNAFAHLESSLGWHRVVQQYPEIEFVRFMRDKPVDTLQQMMNSNLNSPRVSSAGRLFDAVAALLGICVERIHYEGEAAMQLEAMAERADAGVTPYPVTLDAETDQGIFRIGWHDLWRCLLEDIARNEAVMNIAARFHITLAELLNKMVVDLSELHCFEQVVLCGGVMQNRLLTQYFIERMAANGMDVIYPEKIPANDSSISLGQAAIVAAHRLI
jgi:hydrogenase maturation protein HypF